MSVTCVHDHLPIYRVVKRGWADPVDAAFSQLPYVDNRWNTPEFPALYCCCSETVARGIVRDVFRITGVDLADLQETVHPQLVEIHWVGEPTDMISEGAIVSLGFSPEYPRGADHYQTRRAATQLHAEGAAGVLCRSASLDRLGFQGWTGEHSSWSELVIYTENSRLRPSVLRRREDLDWLQN